MLNVIKKELASLVYLVKRCLAFIGFNTPPTIFIVGAQKAGTTSLHDYLSEHPKIALGLIKEVRFFSVDANYSKGQLWYHSFFPYVGRKHTLDATPEYLYYPYVAERLWKYNPKAKIIVILRNPIDRAYSAWNMYKQFGEQSSSFNHSFLKSLKDKKPELFERVYNKGYLGFNEMIDFEMENLKKDGDYLDDFGIIRRGFYDEQLINLLRYFGENQVLILYTDNLQNKRVKTLNEILTFIGLPDHNWSKVIGSTLGNRRKYDSSIDDELWERLYDIYKPHNERLATMLNEKVNWI
jgi:hypothetical protein